MIAALGSLVGRIVNSPSTCVSRTDKVRSSNNKFACPHCYSRSIQAMSWLKTQLWDLHDEVIDEANDADKNNTRLHRLVTILEAFGESRWPKALPILEKYTWMGIPLRVCLASFKAMSFIASHAPIRVCQRASSLVPPFFDFLCTIQVQEITIRVYSDASRNGEVRIAAFRAFMSTINCDSPPPTDTLRTIARSIHLEKDRQVQSAVYTHLKALEITKDPLLKCRYQPIMIT